MLPWPDCETFLQQVEQAVESRVREIHFRSVRSTIESQAPELVGRIATDLWPEPGQRR
jgi:hypothetical protein